MIAYKAATRSGKAGFITKPTASSPEGVLETVTVPHDKVYFLSCSVCKFCWFHAATLLNIYCDQHINHNKHSRNTPVTNVLIKIKLSGVQTIKYQRDIGKEEEEVVADGKPNQNTAICPILIKTILL